MRPLLVLAVVATLAACGQKDAPVPAAPPAAAAPAMPAGHPGQDMPVPPHGAPPPLDVCGSFPLATVEAALGGIKRARPLVPAPDSPPGAYAGGCQWIAEKMKSVRVEIGTAASLAAISHPDAKSFLAEAAAANLPDTVPLAGLGEAALIREDGPVFVVIAGQGQRVVQVISGDIGREATIAIARAALE